MSDPWARPDTDEKPAGPPDEDRTRSSDAPASNGHTNGHDANGRTNGHGSDGHDANGRAPGRGDAGADPELVRAFGRPSGVADSFGRGDAAPAAPAVPGSPPPAAALVSAFGRPSGAGETLQRPAPARADGEAEDPFWSGESERDPWRDPSAAAELGGPALGDTSRGGDLRGPGPRLSAREVILGGRVRPTALALLAAIALLVGAVGGTAGYLVAGGADELTDPGASLAQVEPGKERPAGSVAGIAGRVVPAVVSLELRSGSTGGTGSGVVLDGEGHIITNNHVVSLAATDPRATLEAVFASGLRAPARIVGRDPETDLAVVKVELANPTVAQLGRSSSLQVGDGVIAIGSPLGLAGTVTEGIVSSVNRPVRLDAETGDSNPVIDAIQTDAAINPGNSGGALVDSTGAVVGINTAIRTLGQSGSGGSIGLGFAIPIDDARVIAESLIRTGTFAHTDLGVNAKSVTDGTSDGAQVLNVRGGGTAARAGVVEGDVIVRVDARPIASPDELVVAVREHRPGDQVTLGVVRQGRPLTLQATL